MIIALLVALLLPALAKARAMADRIVCASNEREILLGMITYASSNQGEFPLTPAINWGPAYANAPTWPHGWAAGQTAQEQVHLWYQYGMSYQLGHGFEANPCLSEWLLVLEGYMSSAGFICPSDPIAIGPSSEYVTNNNASSWMPNFEKIGTTSPGWNTGEGDSYSIAFPFVMNAPGGLGLLPAPWWNTIGATSDVPLLSDMAPMDDALGDTGGPFLRFTTTLPGQNPFGRYIYNSGNHNGDGQNVGFGDGHVVWETNPYCGQNGDNIFTYSTATDPVNGTTDTHQVGLSLGGGQEPSPQCNAKSPPFDICMTPVRTVNPSVIPTYGAW